MNKKKKKSNHKKISPRDSLELRMEEEDELDDAFLEEQEDLSATLDPPVVSEWIMRPQDVLEDISKEKDPYMVIHYLDQLEASMDLLEAYAENELFLEDLKEALPLETIMYLGQMNENATRELFSRLENIISDLAERGEHMVKKSVKEFLDDYGDHLPLALAILAYFTYDFDEILENDNSFPEARSIINLYKNLIANPKMSSLVKQFCEEELEQLEIILDSLTEGDEED